MKPQLLLIYLLALSACSEAPKYQIVFSHQDTCRIIINDLQFERANNTERPCMREPKTGTPQIVTVNFLSESCNAYRYRDRKSVV